MKLPGYWHLLGYLLAGVLSVSAQTFVGTNSPGQGSNFTFTVVAGATNLSVVVSNNATAYSCLLLKKGGTPTDTIFDFAARLDGQTNEINLEAPEFATGSYGLRVSTPAASTTQAFSVILTTNRTDLRSAGYPVSKPLVFTTTGSLTNAGSGAWQYFQVDVPSNLLTGWRIVLSSTNTTTPGLYIRRGQLPNTGAYDKAVAPGQPIDTIIFTSAEATNATYFIGVYQASGVASSANYILSTELASITTLTWDPGTTDAGTQVFTNQSVTGGDYYFAITTGNTADLVWRTALNVQTNEADVYLSQGTLPSTSSYNYASTRVGSDGFVLAQGPQFSPGQNWYILVHATPRAAWNLVTGEAYVQQLPALAPDASSGATVTMGAEGMHFFKTTITTNTLAWRLWLNGLSNQMYVKQSAAPHPYSTSTYDLTQPGQMLVVPTYLNVGSQYFVGVVGNPGLNFTLDSRQQAVTNLNFSLTNNVTVTGYGYTTFLVQVPVQQIAWQVAVTPVSGNANVAVRLNNVPNEYVNDAFSEPPAGVGASVTLVPPTLSNGSFYVTVYGTGPYTVTLFNGQPVITTVDYVFSITNDEPNQVGWRYYTVVNTAEQLGSLGWELDLSNAPPGAEIAIRRNAVPGQWNYRNNPYDYTGYSSLGYVDLSSTLGFLQQPNHPADVWYIGIYSPSAALGNFVLTGSQLTGPPVNFDGAGSTLGVTNQPVGKFQYFTFTVPPDALGWDLRLTNVTGNPQLYICRDQLPPGPGYGWSPSYSSSWPSGYEWTVGYDWTDDYYNPGNVISYGQVFAVGMGNPLSPGTYYVGVYDYTGTTPLSYTVLSRGIGASYSIPVTPIAFSNGVVTVPSLAPRQAAYYSLTVPSNQPSWRVELDTNVGDVMMLIQKDALPNSQSYGGAAYSLSGGRVMEKPGSEQYLMMPPYNQTNITAGNYFIAVVSQGVNSTGNTIGTGTSGYTLGSYGSITVTNLGVVDSSGATDLLATNTHCPAGQFSAYSFSVPANTLALEVFLTNTTGSPYMYLRADAQLPGGPDGYGNDGGQGASWGSSTLINIASPSATNYTLMVQAEQGGGDASFTVDVHAIGPTAVSFDGGNASITNQAVNVWQYFKIVVPPDALGWDLRLTNVTGNPQLYICRDLPPPGPGYGWSPSYSSSWPSGYEWTVGYDWTDDYYNPGNVISYGQVFAVGMGNPLSPGTYYVGVYDYTGTTPLSYTVLSRGIGASYSIPVTPIAFSNGVVTVPSLAPRQAAYYSLTVPSNQPSWRVELDTNVGDVMMLIQKDALPNSQSYGGAAYSLSGGRVMEKPGSEQYLMMPPYNQTNITAGNYFIAVVSQGVNSTGNTIGTGTSGYTLGSYGSITVTNLGVVDSSGATDLLATNTHCPAGQFSAYSFSVPANTLALEVFLTNTTGSPYMYLRADAQLPGGPDGYGNDGGQGASWGSSTLINIASPSATNYTLMVQAEQGGGDASFTVDVHAIGPTAVSFDGGNASITNQAVNVWQYFKIVVPPDALGWDLRLTNVTGNPQLYICRDLPPPGPGYGWSPSYSSSWPSGYEWTVGYDWTDDYYNPGNVISYGQVFAVGMGNPLSPGTYYVGVYDYTGTTPLSYTVLSRGIGASYSIPVTPIAFSNGVVTVPSLAPRQAAYYSLTVPANEPSWKVRLTDVSGESMMLIQNGALPNSQSYNGAAYSLSGGRVMQKAGNEQYLMLPISGTSNLVVAGTYYLAVVSQGVNPTGNTIGTNTSAYTLTSFGPEGITNLGTVGAVDLLQTNAIQGGENILDQFSVPPGTLAVEARLDNVTGYPVMSLRTGTNVVAPYNGYGYDGGVGASWISSTLITLPNPTATNYSLTVQASYLGGLYPDADFTVHVRQMPAPPLPFDSGIAASNVVLNFLSEQYLPGGAGFVLNLGVTPGVTNTLQASTNLIDWITLTTFVSSSNSWIYTDLNASQYPYRFYRLEAPAIGLSGVLQDGQSAFYTVNVPATFNGQPVIGWKLDVTTASGSASIRVSPGAVPGSGGCADSPFVTSEGIYVPPYLTPGVWYVEVRGSGTTSYTLVSHNLQLARPAWTMPAVGASVTTTGLPPAGPLFADTGVDTNGMPLQGVEADQGTDLAKGAFDYYAIMVPTNNSGILRTRLDAISGNPNLYIRVGAPSTLSHYSGGSCGNTLYDRSLSASAGSEYGNWVPLNGRFEVALTNGTWYLAVQAGGNSNVRYRLRMDTGGITNLALNGGSATNQQMAAGDWLYYAFQIPTNAPVNWNVTFSVQLGSVVMSVRDRVPPGQATTTTDYRDWSSGLDYKNHGPYPSYSSPGTYTLPCPPVRPGNTYYLGFRAVNDATFSVSSGTNGVNIDYTNTIPFYNGFTSTTIPAFGLMKYRVDVPPDAVRWIHTSTNASSVWLFLDQGSAPTLTTVDDWYSINAVNSSFNVFLQTPGYWPWQPGYSYFLAVTNTSASPQPFSFRLNGEGPGSGVFKFTSFNYQANGNVQLNMTLVPGLTYQVQSSTNLVNWTILTTITPSTSLYSLIVSSSGYPAQFYRLQEQ